MLTLGIFELTDCGGCALSMLLLGKKFVELTKYYKIKRFHMASSYEEGGEVDVGIVTGSVATERDLLLLQEARKKSKFLIALGTCATHGGVQSSVEIKLEEKLERVYGRKDNPWKALEPSPVIEYVKVDYALPGCPYNPEDIFQILLNLSHGVKPPTRDYPVCLECKLNEYECVLIKKGIPCLGPITSGGCNAACPSLGLGCIGCAGPLPKGANPASELEILKKKGYNEEYIKKNFKTFSKLEVPKW